MSEAERRPIVVFADDEASIRRLMVATMAGSGIHLVAVADGAEALAAVDRLLPELVVLDIVMPRMTGIEVCRALKSEARTRHIRTWLLSAYVRTDGTRSPDAPADACIQKPFSPLALRTRIEEAVRRVIIVGR